MITLILAAVATASTPAPPSPEEFARRLDALGGPARALALTCVAHSVNSDDLEAFVDGNPAFLAYDSSQAERFLARKPGKAWGFRMKGSSYVIAKTETGVCSVFAESADRTRGVSDLKAVIDLLYAGGPVTHLDGSKEGLKNDLVEFDGWGVYDPGLKKTYWFSVNVPKKDGALADVVYSVYVTTANAP